MTYFKGKSNVRKHKRLRVFWRSLAESNSLSTADYMNNTRDGVAISIFM